MTTDKQTLNLDQIRIDGGTQPRVAIDQGIVDEYAEQYSTGVDLNPVVVFHDGATYWLADGFHRYWANRKIKSDYIFAYVHHGTQRDAILYSVGANATHGLRRTNGDKRKAVLTLLEDDEWSKWSDSDIARQCCVNQSTVTRHRTSLMQSISEPRSTNASTRTYKTKHGTVATMNTAKIGRHRNRGPDSPNPIRQPRPALAQTHLNLPHDPAYGARAIVAAMGEEYAHRLIESLTTYLREKNEGDS
ncbi:MAG: hypothetical protein JJU36_05795 [Phycisphaeraceae bacterium]|nr:hypothetical protein [Phycisphaeraceae bacterium]